jgi:hypothetical protein
MEQHEKRRASAQIATKTAARRRAFKAWKAAHAIRLKQGICNRADCFVCSRALTDPASRARWVGPECWELVVQQPVDQMKTLALEFPDADPATPAAWLERLSWRAAPGNRPHDERAFVTALLEAELWLLREYGVGAHFRHYRDGETLIEIRASKARKRRDRVMGLAPAGAPAKALDGLPATDPSSD